MTSSDKSYFDSKFKSLREEVEHINRGLYGDGRNGQNGLIYKDQDKEKRIKSLEEDRSRVRWIAFGFGMAAIGVFKFIVFIIEKLV